jgi:two-component system sensor histidine kinase HydH
MVISFIRDIAERKRFEQARRERDFMRAEQLNATAQVAAGVAHELRNPLTGIKGLVQVLKRECDAIGHPTAGEDLQIIEQEIRRMEKTLQTFLDFARPPKPSRRRIRPAELVERTFALVGGRAAKQRVSLEFAPPAGDPIEVEADPDQVHQLLVNLALNALDVMPQGGRFAVELSRGRDGVILRTTDTGPGIPPALLPKLFRPFVSGKETGIGLGLAVSRRIAEDHGGSLTADNRPGPDGRPAGAVFTLTLPLHAPADPGIPSAARTPPMSDR